MLKSSYLVFSFIAVFFVSCTGQTISNSGLRKVTSVQVEEHLDSLLAMQMNDSAIKYMSRILALYPDTVVYNAHLAHAYILNRQFEQAYPYIKKAILLDSTDVYAITLRGVYYENIGDFYNAHIDYLYASSMSSDNLTAMNGLGKMYFIEKKYSLAIDQFEKVLTKDSMFDRAMIHLSLSYYYANRSDAALEYANKVIRFFPNLAEGYFNRSLILFRLNNYAASLIDANTSISMDSNNSEYYLNRGLIYNSLKMKSESCDDLNTALKLGNIKASSLVENYCK